MTLISAAEMAAIQGLAESGMVTSVAVFHQVTTAGDDGRVATYPATADFTVTGWIKEITPDSVMAGVHSGEIGVVETHVLRVPVGTAIVSGDKIVSGTASLIVQHTSAEDTYQPWLICTLKMLE